MVQTDHGAGDLPYVQAVVHGSDGRHVDQRDLNAAVGVARVSFRKGAQLTGRINLQFKAAGEVLFQIIAEGVSDGGFHALFGGQFGGM